MNKFSSPRAWLMLWGGIGAAFLVYVIVAASVQPGHTGSSNAPASAAKRDASLVVGEMADFQYALMKTRAPTIPFELDGREVTLSDFRGKAVLVNFWATWCAPCLKELPSLDALEDKLGSANFEVVAIAADPRGPEAAGAFMERLNIKNLKLYADPRLVFTSAIGGADILPVSILYDAEGVEVGRLVGEADWASPEAAALVGAFIPS